MEDVVVVDEESTWTVTRPYRRMANDEDSSSRSATRVMNTTNVEG
jgi:hypothetical protein